MKALPEEIGARHHTDTFRIISAMNAKTRRFAAVFLSTLLYAQAGLCVAAASLVVLKHPIIAGPASADDIVARHVN